MLSNNTEKYCYKPNQILIIFRTKFATLIDYAFNITKKVVGV